MSKDGIIHSDGDEEGGRGLTLAADLSSILNNPDFCDVVLVSEEGHRISACRALLAARSPLFRRILITGPSLDTRHSPDIPLPSIRTCALLPTLVYIYTGALSTHPLTLHNVVDIIHASRYFLLPPLHTLAFSFFSAQMQSPTLAIHQLPALLSRALELLTPASETPLFSQLVKAIDISSSSLHYKADLSSEAMCFYLEETRNSTVRISALGYARLRFVLMWCAHLTSPVAEEAMKKYLPALHAEFFCSTFDDTQHAACLETLKSYQRSLQAWFQPLLQCLDIFQVHPQILADVIEPLGIIEPSNLLHIYGFQATISEDTALLQWEQRYDCESFDIREEACVLTYVSRGFATTKLPVTRTMGVFEWDFVVEKSCSSLGVGICSIPAHTPAESKSSWLGFESFGWVLACTGELFHNVKDCYEGKVGYAPEFGTGSRIRVHLDLTSGTCSFTVDGKACGVAWTNIPPKVYPAATVRTSGSCVRLEVARDGDKRMLLELFQSSAKNAYSVPTSSDKEERESMIKGGGEGGGQMGSDLAADLGNILNNPAFGDLTLVSKDGDRLWACRILLAARSHVFERMLLNGVTLETQNSADVSLPSIHTCALLCVLEYIYTGILSKNCLTLDSALDVIHAARYLLLTQLQNLAVSFFFEHAHRLQYPSCNLVNRLSRAMEHLSLDSDVHVLSVYVNAIMQFPEVLDNAAEFSYEALCFFLHKTQTKCIGLSAFEYTRLRCTLMWCAHSISTLAEEALSEYMPAQQSDFLSRSFDVRRARRSAVLESLALFQGSLKDRLKPLLQHLDLFRVLPEILLRVLEPLGIVHPSYLLHILRFQSVFSQHVSVLRWRDGAHPSHFAIQEEGCVLENTSKRNLFGFATTRLPITSSTGILEWDVVVERTCPHLGIGFCSTEAPSHASTEYAWLGYKRYGWILGCCGSLFHNVKPGIKGKLYAPKFGNGARIRVLIDWTTSECSFIVNGIACGMAWKNIPPEVYPTVTMQSPGKLRLEVAGDTAKEKLFTSLRLAGA